MKHPIVLRAILIQFPDLSLDFQCCLSQIPTKTSYSILKPGFLHVLIETIDRLVYSEAFQVLEKPSFNISEEQLSFSFPMEIT